jgi:hypothetical protein
MTMLPWESTNVCRKFGRGERVFGKLVGVLLHQMKKPALSFHTIHKYSFLVIILQKTLLFNEDKQVGPDV